MCSPAVSSGLSLAAIRCWASWLARSISCRQLNRSPSQTRAHRSGTASATAPTRSARLASMPLMPGPPNGRRFPVAWRDGRQPSAWYQHRSREMKPGRLWSPLHLPRRVVVDQVITASCEATDGAPGVVGGAKGLDMAPGCRELRPAGKADGHKHASGRRDELGCTDLARVRSGPACGGRAWRGRARC